MDANLETISDLKDFITLSATQPGLKELFSVPRNGFSRNRKPGSERLVLMLVDFFRKSYSLEAADFYSLINCEEAKVTKSAFCQQRMKVNGLFFACLNEAPVEGFYRHYGENIKRWNSFRPIAIDGPIACLINTEAINQDRKHQYKTNRNIAFGMMKNRVVGLFIACNPEKVPQHLEALFIQHIGPVRPDRKYPHRRVTVKARSKYQALTNYKRAIGA